MRSGPPWPQTPRSGKCTTSTSGPSAAARSPSRATWSQLPGSDPGGLLRRMQRVLARAVRDRPRDAADRTHRGRRSGLRQHLRANSRGLSIAEAPGGRSRVFACGEPTLTVMSVTDMDVSTPQMAPTLGARPQSAGGRSRQATRERLLTAGRVLFARDGVHGVTRSRHRTSGRGGRRNLLPPFRRQAGDVPGDRPRGCRRPARATRRVDPTRPGRRPRACGPTPKP